MLGLKEKEKYSSQQSMHSAYKQSNHAHLQSNCSDSLIHIHHPGSRKVVAAWEQEMARVIVNT